MMIMNFQHPASEHAQALINFHNHVFFFLLIIIFVIIWLLKLVFLFIIKQDNKLITKIVIEKQHTLYLFLYLKKNIIYKLKNILKHIFIPSVFLYKDVDVYKYRWAKITWYWIYVLSEYFYRKFVIFYTKKLINNVIIKTLNAKWSSKLIYLLYNITYIINNFIFIKEDSIKENYIDSSNQAYLNKMVSYPYNRTTNEDLLKFNLLNEFSQIEPFIVKFGHFYKKKNFFFGTQLFFDLKKFFLPLMNQLNFRQLELYFHNQVTFVDYTSFIEFCYYIDKLRDLRSNNLIINTLALLDINFFKKEVSVSKFKRETFKTDKIFSFSRSVFFNNWIETVFEKEHLTEDDSDLEFYNGVYFSNLCLKTFDFFKKYKVQEEELDDYLNKDLLYSGKSIGHKYIKRFEKEKSFRKKFFWKDENIILNSFFFKFLLNSYIYSKVLTSNYLNIHKVNFSKYNYIRANKILDFSSTYKFDNRMSNAGFYGNFILSNSNYSYFLYYNNFKHNLKLEWIWTFIPTIILIIILYPSLLLLYSYDKPYITKPYLTIKVIGNQWYWSYEYSDNSILFDYDNDDGLSDDGDSKKVPSKITIDTIKFDSYMLNEDDLELGQLRLLEVDRRLVLPVGVCIRIVTTSTDVLHSWAVPSLGIKIDSVPGRLNQFWLVINKPGVFYGQCSELCGVNHAFMPIAVEGVSLDQYYDFLYNYYSKIDK